MSSIQSGRKRRHRDGREDGGTSDDADDVDAKATGAQIYAEQDRVQEGKGEKQIGNDTDRRRPTRRKGNWQEPSSYQVVTPQGDRLTVRTPRNAPPRDMAVYLMANLLLIMIVLYP